MKTMLQLCGPDVQFIYVISTFEYIPSFEFELQCSLRAMKTIVWTLEGYSPSISLDWRQALAVCNRGVPLTEHRNK